MAAFTYEFSCGRGFHNVSAQVAGEICERLEQSAGGLSPQTLLDASRDESAPLHNYFEWDDTAAAEKYRLEQARLIICNIRIVRSDDTQERENIKERGFVSTPQKGVYVSMETALSRDDYTMHMLAQARRDSEIFLAKYRRIEELAGVTAAIESFLKVG